MAKRKPDSYQLEHDESHRSKKPKTNDVDSTAIAPAALSEQQAVALRGQQLVDDDLKKSRESRKRAKRHARRQHREAEAASEPAHETKLEVNGDPMISGQPLTSRAAGPRKQERHEASQKELGINAAVVAAEQKKPAAKGSATVPRQPSRTHKKGKREERRQEGQQHRIPEGETHDAKTIGKTAIQDTVQESHKLPAWSVSEAVGGQMLDLDPQFSPNEEYLLVAYESSVNVYSTATSLLVQKLRVDRSDRVSAFAFSSADSSHFYMSTQSGNIQIWDWLEGRKLHSWHTRCHILALATPAADPEDASSDLVYTINRKGIGPWRISAHRLVPGQEAHGTDSMTLRTSKEPITAFKIVENGRIIIATSGSVLTLGIVKSSGQPPSSDTSYTWRDIECPEWISCFDVRTVKPDENPKKSKTSNVQQVPQTDIIVGGLRGSLHVYDDFLRQLLRCEMKSDKGPATDLTSRMKHWHRNAVLSVKWSRDGNYIISGGLETVLMMWQLETGHLDTLPHLGAPVEGLVVSPLGSSYAIRLADNSVMILSTAELKPTFSVAGIQLPAEGTARTQLPYLSNVDAPLLDSTPTQRLHIPVVSGPSGLLCAVPFATSSRVPSLLPQHASYLQTFDTSSAHQISRQALARTKATDLNVGPESNTIEEPDVVLMQISHDGQWLATVDEWMPPRRDMAILTHDDKQAIEAQRSRRETYLKFWSWNNDSKVWELVSRIDNPHALHSGLADQDHRALELTSDPSSNNFATIGEDKVVRMWTPVARQRHGLAVKTKEGQGLKGWRCQSTMSVDTGALSSQTCMEAKLAYSQDGSCLAAACISSSPWTVHFIDTLSGNVRVGPYGPFTGPLFGLGIVDRYLILLSDQLCVWNLVTHQLVYGFELASPAPLSVSHVLPMHMTVDVQGGTFAVVLSEGTDVVSEKGRAQLGSEIMVFEPTNPMPIFIQKTPQQTTALTTLYNRPGYLAVDSAAEIRVLSPARVGPDPTTALPSPPQTPSRGLHEVYGDPKNNHGIRAEEARRQIAASLPASNVEARMDDDDANVVPPEKLAEVFDVGPAYAMPPVTELFERVARLFAGKSAV